MLIWDIDVVVGFTHPDDRVGSLKSVVSEGLRFVNHDASNGCGVCLEMHVASFLGLCTNRNTHANSPVSAIRGGILHRLTIDTCGDDHDLRCLFSLCSIVAISIRVVLVFQAGVVMVVNDSLHTWER